MSESASSSTDPSDTDRVTTAFAAGPARQYPSRDSRRARAYVTADHRPEPGPWSAPDQAYALALSIIREIGWAAARARAHLRGRPVGRECWHRKAAVLDRITLDDEHSGPPPVGRRHHPKARPPFLAPVGCRVVASRVPRPSPRRRT
ncbi:hypothetical protein NGM36_09915 [Streptomyces mutabilis]|uniref:hypothetical protein n=1 Tax=Streptomyces mutabilis TaxID=67332 RepID=UPI0022BA67A0|nr:hypothetical protein [Streptomyces mutabilis]MCZ9350102.1 hypothetical protein [Streptomyces mutabilis]